MERLLGRAARLEEALSGGALRNRMKLAGAYAARALARKASAPYHFAKSMAIAPPERLRIAPPDIQTADPTVANDIYAGYFAFEGKTVQAQGVSPFSLAAPSPGWRRALTGFSWLRHLRAAERSLAQANAKALVGEFLSLPRLPADDPALEPAVVARRLLSFLSQSPVLLDGADGEFYDAFMLSLAQCARRLWRALASGQARGAEGVACAVALTEFAICADTGRKIASQVSRALSSQLESQILSDGGHVSRNPQIAVDMLLDLLPLRQVIAARGLQAPDALLRAIDRMMPALRMMQHGDGSLALFNGMGATALDQLLSVLAHEDARGAPPLNAPYSGYQRMDGRDALVLIDAGAPPPPEFSRAAHAGCLSFEFSLGTERVVVNCGAPPPPDGVVRELARATAAHSTLVLGDQSSARFASAASGPGVAGRILSGPRRAELHRRDQQGATTLLLAHDGYAREFGLIHARDLILAHDGSMLSGRDRLLASEAARSGNAPNDFTIRFHLHPRVRAAPRGVGVELKLSSGETLIFEAEGATPRIEESIFFASPGGARKTSQIAVSGNAAGGAEIRWSFSRVGAVP